MINPKKPITDNSISHPAASLLDTNTQPAINKPTDPKAPIALVAIGGNALLPDAEHASVAEIQLELGRTLQALERPDEAEASFQRALEIRDAAFGPEHPNLAEALVGLGVLYLERGQPTRARDALERAVRLLRPRPE